ncbi:MAG: DNA-processing protein DprA [Clostridiales bacterium]|jgi:DNA processing protein|nr:DNA-processing protein DprA [Clostridiales bacterium]
MEENIYLIWLSQINGLGMKKQDLLLNFFGSAKEIFFATEKQLSSVKGLFAQNISSIIIKQKMELLDQIKKMLFDKNIKYVSKFDSGYPENLLNISNPPIGLYVLGNLPAGNKPKISIIGSRKCSDYGKAVSFKFAKELAQNDVIIVSGFARGIDTQAHLGALDADGITIGVLGCGVDVCYPPENKNIIGAVLKKGCFVSEYPPETKPFASHFPVRNRIISGLSSATLIIEAEKHSGTHITCDQALEQGRDVFAVPGNITSRFSQGTNALISQGANMALCPGDILDYLNMNSNIAVNKNETPQLELENEEKLIYGCIGLEPVDIEQIIIETKCQVSTAVFILTELELKGYIKQLPGQKYARAI